MAGQGSLRQRTSRFRCGRQTLANGWGIVVCLLGVLTGSITWANGAGNANPMDVRVRLRLETLTPSPWSVRLRLVDPIDKDANLGEVRNFSTAATSSGMFDVDHSGKVLSLRPRHATSVCDIELRVRGSQGASLWIEPIDSASPEGSIAAPREIPLVDLRRSEEIRSDSWPAADRDARAAVRWTLTRAPSDQLRLEADRRVPIYRPGDSLNLTMRVNGMIEYASRSYYVGLEVYRVKDGESVITKRWPISIDADGNSESIPWSHLVPEVGGVYEVRVQVDTEEETLWSRLRRRTPPIARSTHCIAVQHGAGQAAVEPAAWREVGVIRPSESNWSVGQWLPKSTTLLIPSSALPVNQSLDSDSHAGQTISVLPPAGTFQATLPVKTPGYPHHVTLRLPSNSRGNLLIQVGPSRDALTTSIVVEGDPGIVHADAWREHTFVHYAEVDDQIWLTNLDLGGATPFESIRVQAGPLRLAPSSTDTTSTDTTSQPSPGARLAALRLGNLDWMKSVTADVARRTPLTGCSPSTIGLNQLWVAAERIVDHTRAHGCNAIVIPANDGFRAWYQSSLFQPYVDNTTPRERHLECLLTLLESSQLAVFVELKPNMLLTEIERSIGRNESQLAELTKRGAAAPVSDDERSSAEAAPPRTSYNPLNPQVQLVIAKLVRELEQTCRPYTAFAGIIVDCDGDGTSHVHPPSDAANDSGSITLFGKDHSLEGNVAQLRNWMLQNGNDGFDLWQQQQLRSCLQQITQASSDCSVRLLIRESFPLELDTSHRAVSSTPSPGSVPGSLEELMIHSFRYEPADVLARKSLMENKLGSASGPLASILFGEEHRGVSPQMARGHLVGDLSRLLDRTNPTLLVLDASLLANHVRDDLTANLRTFCALPTVEWKRSNPIDSASHTVHVRTGVSDGHLYVSMISVVPWSCDVDLEMSAPVTWNVLEDGRNELVNRRLNSSGGTRTRVTIPTGRMVLLRSQDASAISIRSWTTRASGGPEAIESIKQKVTLIVERIGILNNFRPYEVLNNGGFEQTGDMGLVGWLHAQHPPGCVRVDDKEFVEGSRSVLLTTSTPAVARTWLVSETIPPPASGRLAVSLASRAESKDDETKHHLRVSLEATRRGDPIRFSSDLSIERNGQWSERLVILEVDELDASEMDSLRLTIDSRSDGRVWIDDVQLHDRFATASERAKLQNQAFLAVQGLQRGNLLHSGKLLQNHWGRYLLTLGANENSMRVIEAVPVSNESPGVAERIRSMLPRPLRF